MLAVAGKVYGMCSMLWDPGSHFNRKTLQFDDPELLKGFQGIMGMKRDERQPAGGPATKNPKAQ